MLKYISAIVLSATCALLAQTTVTPKQFAMEPQIAFDWTVKVISPILADYANNPREITAVRHRILKLSQLINAKTIDYRALPAYNPGNSTMLAHLDYDTVQKRPVLMLFVPAMQVDQKKHSGKDFRDNVALVFAHEMIHHEQVFETHEFHLRVNEPWGLDGAREEAAAFGKTIIQIVRPWAQQGRVPDPTLLKISEQLASLNDNYADPRWVMAFINYVR